MDRQGYEDVRNYGSGIVNDNSVRLLSYCSVYQLSIMGSWYCRCDVHHFTCYCNDGQTRKEIDHNLSSHRKLFRSVHVYCGAEPPANLDHHLLVGNIMLNPYGLSKQHVKPRLDTRLLVEDPCLTSQYNIEVNNAFTALGKLTQDVEHAWEQV